jgi:peptidoglycan/LPS O-acetylase OafA/YrhL
VSFSLFKIFSIPFLAFGYLFYLSNYGAYNYFSFNQEIYGTYYARIAVFAYYLPDIFFFISGYLLSRKLIQLDEVS